MARKHLFPLVVILAAAVVAGLLALSHTRALAGATGVATSSDPAISFRLKRLDRFEQSLRKQLANARTTPTPTTVHREAPVQRATSPSYDDDDEWDGASDSEGEDGERDD
jgi:hypothetical protein